MRKALHMLACVYVCTPPLFAYLGWGVPALVAGTFALVWWMNGWRPWSPGFK